MYPVLKIMHMLNFLDTFSMGITVTGYHKPNSRLPNGLWRMICDVILKLLFFACYKPIKLICEMKKNCFSPFQNCSFPP